MRVGPRVIEPQNASVRLSTASSTIPHQRLEGLARSEHPCRQ